MVGCCPGSRRTFAPALVWRSSKVTWCCGNQPPTIRSLSPATPSATKWTPPSTLSTWSERVTRFTADDARKGDDAELDARIKAAVRSRDGGPNAAYLRVYIEDPWCR